MCVCRWFTVCTYKCVFAGEPIQQSLPASWLCVTRTTKQIRMNSWDKDKEDRSTPQTIDKRSTGVTTTGVKLRSTFNSLDWQTVSLLPAFCCPNQAQHEPIGSNNAGCVCGRGPPHSTRTWFPKCIKRRTLGNDLSTNGLGRVKPDYILVAFPR